MSIYVFETIIHVILNKRGLRHWYIIYAAYIFSVLFQCSMLCKHIYEKEAIMQYILSKHTRGQCPISGSSLMSDNLHLPIPPLH